jgi:hypothetical protein
MVANREEDTISHDCWQKLLNEEREQNPADDGEVQIVHQKWVFQNKGLTPLHHFSSTEHNDVV